MRRLMFSLSALVVTVALWSAAPSSADPSPDADAKAQIARARAHFARGAALMKDEKYAEAEAAFRKAVAITPNDTTALQALGTAMEKEGKYEEAAKIYEQVTNILLADPGTAPKNTPMPVQNSGTTAPPAKPATPRHAVPAAAAAAVTASAAAAGRSVAP